MASTTNGRKAFLTGVSGQDGGYLSELLLAKGYEVHGLQGPPPPAGAPPPPGGLHLHAGDLTDAPRLESLMSELKPDEVYNLGALSHPASSTTSPLPSADVTGLGPLRLLEALRKSGLAGKTRFFQASSAEVFGTPLEVPQDEHTPFHPRNPYGAAKAFAHHMTVQYRENQGFFACAAILYNHESPRRGKAFVTRKITSTLAAIAAGSGEKLRLGDLEAKRDWGFAGDYVEAMWRMIQLEKAEDLVLATGKSHSVRDFVEEAFSYAGLDWRAHVETDPNLVRPPEKVPLVGNASRAAERLGWKPQVDFKGLVRMMVDADFKAVGLKPPSA